MTATPSISTSIASWKSACTPWMVAGTGGSGRTAAAAMMPSKSSPDIDSFDHLVVGPGEEPARGVILAIAESREERRAAGVGDEPGGDCFVAPRGEIAPEHRGRLACGDLERDRAIDEHRQICWEARGDQGSRVHDRPHAVDASAYQHLVPLEVGITGGDQSGLFEYE